MTVVLDEPYLFILLNEDGRWFLSVPCAASAVSYDRYVELNRVQIETFEAHGNEVIQLIARNIQNSAPRANLEKDFFVKNVDEQTRDRLDSTITESGRRTVLQFFRTEEPNLPLWWEEGMPKIVQQLFEWSDAWIFTSLYMTTKTENTLDLSLLIGCCDMLNHSIVSQIELNSAFRKFDAYNVVHLVGRKVIYSPLGISISDSSEKKRGGLFSRVDLTMSCMNAKKNGLSHKEIDEGIDYFQEDEINDAYRKYARKNS